MHPWAEAERVNKVRGVDLNKSEFLQCSVVLRKPAQLSIRLFQEFAIRRNQMEQSAVDLELR
jgi:hypothetical protein